VDQHNGDKLCVLIGGGEPKLRQCLADAGYRTVVTEDATTAIEEIGLAGFTLAALERRALLDTLRACDGNKAAAARALGVCEKTIYNKLKRIRTSD